MNSRREKVYIFIFFTSNLVGMGALVNHQVQISNGLLSLSGLISLSYLFRYNSIFSDALSCIKIIETKNRNTLCKITLLKLALSFYVLSTSLLFVFEARPIIVVGIILFLFSFSFLFGFILYSIRGVFLG
jgi:hypothetical protein